jgi:hypothetical protein
MDCSAERVGFELASGRDTAFSCTSIEKSARRRLPAGASWIRTLRRLRKPSVSHLRRQVVPKKWKCRVRRYDGGGRADSCSGLKVPRAISRRLAQSRPEVRRGWNASSPPYSAPMCTATAASWGRTRGFALAPFFNRGGFWRPPRCRRARSGSPDTVPPASRSARTSSPRGWPSASRVRHRVQPA